jgi:hypothetical protein
MAPPPEQLRQVAKSWLFLTDLAIRQDLREAAHDPIRTLLPGTGAEPVSRDLVEATEAATGRQIFPRLATAGPTQVELSRIWAELRYWAVREA